MWCTHTHRMQFNTGSNAHTHTDTPHRHKYEMSHHIYGYFMYHKRQRRGQRARRRLLMYVWTMDDISCCTLIFIGGYEAGSDILQWNSSDTQETFRRNFSSVHENIIKHFYFMSCCRCFCCGMKWPNCLSILFRSTSMATWLP